MSGAPPLPPPPPPPPKNGGTIPRRNQQIRPHESTTSIPTLDSAPPSGNLSADPDASIMKTMNQLPPPPPPPARRALSPPRNPVSSAASFSTTSTESTNFSALPPPPNVTYNTTTTATNNLARTTPLSDLVTNNDRPKKEDGVDDAPPYLPFLTFVAEKKLDILARRQTHVPICVVATEASHGLAWKNNLQLTDMFQGIVHDFKPDGKPSQLPPFRSVNRSLNLKQVPIQFFLAEHLQPHSYTQAHDMLSDHAKLQDIDGNVAQELLLLEDRVDELLQDRATDDTLEQVTREAYRLTSPLDIPWLLRYRYALDESTNHLEHDLVSCPPVVLLVCTSNEVASPQDVLQELRESPQVLPDGFQNGLYDPNAIRYEVLVLHDAVDGPNNFGEQYLRQTLQNQFGPNAAVLRINSVNKETAEALAEEEDSDLWGGNGTKGNCLSFNDRSMLGRYFQSLITSAVLPALERRIATLNAIVSERKKGMRNLVKSFWRKPKEQQQQMEQQKQIDKSKLTAKYRYDSIESQARLLADTLFLMKDFEAALSAYRLVRDDFKSDKALAHYANVQEMMGMCMYHLDPYARSRDIFAQFETALLGYTRAAEGERAKWGNDPSTRPQAAPHATRLATRLCLLIATASDALTRGRELEVADLLASASSHESSLGAAVLLEQASAFYFQAEMFRKYSFHMLMSGHMFRTAGQDNHAFRCFTSALYVYRHGSWNELHNHLRSALAAQLYSMGRMSIALILYAKLVGTSSGGKVSAKSQQKFLSHLLEICENHPKPALAGSDRMAVPPKIPNNEREAFRNDQLERIVHVIRFTMGASRVLQLPYMNLPLIVDTSVRIWTHAEQHFVGDAKQGEERQEMDFFGTASKGKESIWQELEVMSKAELKASVTSESVLDETITSALSKIKDPKHRRVITQVDKEKQNRNMLERSKRKGSIKPKPVIRAKGEPLFCDFQMKNPLAVDIFMTDIQLVVRMVDGNGRVMTNQDAIEINKGKKSSSKSYTFASTDDMDFSVGDFCRFSEPGEKSCFPVDENPFFVVTKRDVQLLPLADITISAGVCPLVEGDLELLGVRCKLFDKVWVYHPFDIEGPLLQDTRENISNRVRGESMLLKSKVEREMPCLTAELIKRGSDDFNTISTDGGPLLEGQVSEWTIRLRNVGNAPASNVTLKTNLPWVNAVNTENDLLTAEEQEAQATSRCFGPTGTLMSLPMTGETLQETGRLHPGEHVDLPIQMRTSRAGKEGFYMLFGYDLWSPLGDVERHRWLRQTYEVPVYPSLDLSAKVKTAFWNGNEQILSVELTNNRTDRPTDLFVTLDKLSVASRHYKLEALPGQFITSEENGNVLQIGWQERVTIHYKVIPLAEESKVCLLSECSFTEMAKSTTIEAVYSEATDYLCLENARDSFEAAWKGHQIEISKAESSEEGVQPRSIASIRRANTTGSDLAEGELGPVGLPVKLTLRNQLLESAVKLVLSVKDDTTFELIGCNVMPLVFQPQEEKTIPLEALIPRAGIHNLQAFELTVKREEEEFFYPLKQQWIVTVTDSI
ncbi:MAG: hypothetical protein SGBAC_002050 [Bacillariaceae sp.]